MSEYRRQILTGGVVALVVGIVVVAGVIYLPIGNTSTSVSITTSSHSSSSTSNTITTLSINAQINGSTVQSYGSALMITVTVLNNGSTTISIPPLYQIVRSVVVLNSVGASVGGTPTPPSNDQTSLSQQFVFLSSGSSLVAKFTIVFLSSQNATTPNSPTSQYNSTSIDSYGTAYLQGVQSYTIKVNAFYPNGQAVVFIFPLKDEVGT